MLNIHSLPDAQQSALAKLSSQTLAAILATQGDVQSLHIQADDGSRHEVSLPTSVLEMLLEILTQLGQGNSVSITPIHAELTTQQAADLLNISRPTLIKLLDAQAIPYTRKGNRRKVAFIDVMNYKTEQETLRLAALEALGALDQEMDMGY